MTRVEIEDALYDWVFGVLSITTIHAHPNAPRPKTNYALINIVSELPLGHADKDGTLLGDDSVDVDYSMLNDLMVSLNFYYNGSYNYAKSLRNSLEQTLILESLWADGLGFSRTTGIQNVPSEINKQWENRAQFDAFFYLRSEDSENIETIQKIQLTSGIDGEVIEVEKP